MIEVASEERELSGRQKAAVLMMALGPEVSGPIFQHLSEDEIDQLTLEIANLQRVDSDTKTRVIEEFHELVLAHEYVSKGGIEYARELLESGLGPEKADDIIRRLTASLHVRPFDFARKTDPAQLLNFIQNEHPQTIALILAYLHADQASQILSALPPDRQVEVARRIATLDRTSPDILEEIEATLERRLSTFVTQDFTAAGGIEVAVDILNRVDRGTERTIMERLEDEEPELADEIKKRMFVFEDITLLSDRDIQLIVREVDNAEWVLALKTASDDVAERIFRNMSRRAAEMLKEEMEYLGPVRLRDVEDAQQKIVGIIRRLEEAGEIIVARGAEDEIVV